MFLTASVRKVLGLLANGFVTIFLLYSFFITAKFVVQDFTYANMSALNYLKPHPIGYLWDLTFLADNPVVDKNKIRCYLDYYEELLKLFPCLWEDYGVLGYCYFYLGEQDKAIEFLKRGITLSPHCFVNYYNLAMIYIQQSHYHQAADLLHRGLNEPAVKTLTFLTNSQMVYLPLVEAHLKSESGLLAQHIYQIYQSAFFMEEKLNQIDGNDVLKQLVNKIASRLYAF